MPQQTTRRLALLSRYPLRQNDSEHLETWGLQTSQIQKEQLNIGTELQDLALNLLFETHS